MYPHSVGVAVRGRQTVDAIQHVLAVARDARVGRRVEAHRLRDRLDAQPARRHVHLAAGRPAGAAAAARRVQRRRRPPPRRLAVAARRLPEIGRELAGGEPRDHQHQR